MTDLTERLLDVVVVVVVLVLVNQGQLSLQLSDPHSSVEWGTRLKRLDVSSVSPLGDTVRDAEHFVDTLGASGPVSELLKSSCSSPEKSFSLQRQ